MAVLTHFELQRSYATLCGFHMLLDCQTFSFFHIAGQSQILKIVQIVHTLFVVLGFFFLVKRLR